MISKPPFDKVLIANRGEIACRIIRTARSMGVKTVAIYSDADRNARHMNMADEAVYIGPAVAGKSYLNQSDIIQVAKAHGASAIHPGYGFLSENANFAQQVALAEMVFVGPPPNAIRAMGLKDNAKSLMRAHGIPVVPGYDGTDQSNDALAAKAEAIGFPVLIKARAGGGGKGMRRVDLSEAFFEALASAKREAQNAFGDDHVIIEKYIANPRHIEVQIFADKHGNFIHLYERDCTLQRRHQKIIEEAPAPDIDDQMRQAMITAALTAARAVDYVGAGTVEFIADASDGLRPDRFWFMEMNTRLQVEHTVTEMITGFDLVALQLRIAAGLPLPISQQQIEIKGHAIQARLCAEDPANAFLPGTGTIISCALPDENADQRTDHGLHLGGEVTPHYDSLLAKLIAHGNTRQQAIATLRHMLATTDINGLKTNLAFLSHLLTQPAFVENRVSTDFVDTRLDAFETITEPKPQIVALAACCLANRALLDRQTKPHALADYRHFGPAVRFVNFEIAGQHKQAWIEQTSEGAMLVQIAEQTFEVSGDLDAAPVSEFRVGNTTVTVQIIPTQTGFSLIDNRHIWKIRPRDELSIERQSSAMDETTAPMPAIIRHVHVLSGQNVTAGQNLITLEAMKMEHTIRAPRAGEVDIFVSTGERVSEGQLLFTYIATDTNSDL